MRISDRCVVLPRKWPARETLRDNLTAPRTDPEPVNVGGARIAPHPYIRFSSTLLNEDGKPLAGLHLLTFYIHDTEDRRGDPLWTETLPVQTDETGQYTVGLKRLMAF
jgi:hypothetical protein